MVCASCSSLFRLQGHLHSCVFVAQMGLCLVQFQCRKQGPSSQRWFEFRLRFLQLAKKRNALYPVMAVVRFHCPFARLSGCHDGSGNGLTKTYLITHLRDRHCRGIWLCGVCFKTHTLHTKCHHGYTFVPPPDNGDGDVCFVLYDLIKPHVPSCSQLDRVDGLLPIQYDGFTLSLLDSLFSKGLRTIKSIPPKCRLGFSRVLKEALDKVICKPDDISCWVSLLVLPLCLLKTFCPRSNLECKSANKRQRQEESIINAIRSWGVPGGSLQLVRETLAESASPMLDLDEKDLDLSERNLKQCKRKICDGHYTTTVRVLSSSSVAPYNDQPLMDCLSGATVSISDELASSITQVVNLFLDGKCPMILGEYVASAPLTPLVKPGGGIRPIAVGTVWRRMVSKVSVIMVVHSLGGYLDDL
ncbi:hypothetical protein Tco_1537286 [Tanacetum coccineum]